MALLYLLISKYKKYGYGKWTFGAPLKAVTRTDIMPADYDASAIVKKEKLTKEVEITHTTTYDPKVAQENGV